MTDTEKMQERGFYAVIIMMVLIALGAMWFQMQKADCRVQFADRSVEEIVQLCK